MGEAVVVIDSAVVVGSVVDAWLESRDVVICVPKARQNKQFTVL